MNKSRAEYMRQYRQHKRDREKERQTIIGEVKPKRVVRNSTQRTRDWRARVRANSIPSPITGAIQNIIDIRALPLDVAPSTSSSRENVEQMEQDEVTIKQEKLDTDMTHPNNIKVEVHDNNSEHKNKETILKNIQLRIPYLYLVNVQRTRDEVSLESDEAATSNSCIQDTGGESLEVYALENYKTISIKPNIPKSRNCSLLRTQLKPPENSIGIASMRIQDNERSLIKDAQSFVKASFEDIKRIQGNDNGTVLSDATGQNEIETTRNKKNTEASQITGIRQKRQSKKSKHRTITSAEKGKKIKRSERLIQYRVKKRATTTIKEIISVYSDEYSKTMTYKEQQEHWNEVLNMDETFSLPMLAGNISTQACSETSNDNQIFDSIFIKEENINTENVSDENEYETSFDNEHHNALNTGNIEDNIDKVNVKVENEFETKEEEYSYQLPVLNVEIEIKQEPEKDEVI